MGGKKYPYNLAVLLRDQIKYMLPYVDPLEMYMSGGLSAVLDFLEGWVGVGV
jgi:repressor of nif and glnA expression